MAPWRMVGHDRNHRLVMTGLRAPMRLSPMRLKTNEIEDKERRDTLHAAFRQCLNR
jgi:hypothetical protein